MVPEEVEGMVEASQSHGLVTREEAAVFLSKRQIDWRLSSGAWVPIFPGVYRVVGAPQTWMQRLTAAMKWAEAAVLSHRTAAALHGLNPFKEGPVELTSTYKLRAPAGVRVHRVDALSPRDRTGLSGLEVTTVTRTLIDLAAGTDWFTLRRVFDQALREKKTTLEKLGAAAARASNRPGVAEVRRLLREFEGDGGPTESELERRALELIESGGLAKPHVQWTVVVGRRRRRLDLLFKSQGVVVEVDGYASHSGVDAFEDDRARNNSLAVRGLLVLHWTWRAIHDHPEDLLVQLYAALNRPR